MKKIYTLAILFTFGLSAFVYADKYDISNNQLDAIETRVSSMDRGQLVERKYELDLEIDSLKFDSENTQSPAKRKEAEQKLFVAMSERSAIEKALLALIAAGIIDNATEDDDVYIDIIPPVININSGPLVLVELGDTYSDSGATATDNVDGPINVSSSGTVNTSAMGLYTIIYSATDSSGNTTTASKMVQVIDTTAPVLSVAGASSVNTELGQTYIDAGATATDLSGAINVITTGSVDDDEVGTYVLTYIATDSSGNESTATRTVNVVDTTAPVLTVAGSATVSTELGDTYTDAGATATDVSGAITVVTTGSVDTDTVGTYTLTYTATDASDNSTTGTRTVNVVDTTAPVITRTGDYPVRHELGDAYVDGGETATDASGPITVVTTSTVDVDTIGGYLVTYTATDPSGNVATTTRSVYVSDTTAPAITRTGDYPTTVELGSTYTAPDETATDASGSVTVTKSVNGDTDSVGSFLVFYTSTDPSGNVATTTRTVNVVDTTAPVITRTGDYPVTLELGETYIDGGETATDLSGPITVVTTMNGDENSVGSFLVTYTATDPSGNVATTTRSVYVVDTTAPAITRTGDYPVLHNYGDAYVDGGETATDASGPITIVTTSSVDVNTMGGYLVTYTATDPSGNTTVTTRSVYVADRKAPVFTSASNFSADENQKSIGTVTATDLFAVTFSISSPYDQIDITSSGVLTFAASENPNYEAKRVYTATVTATDANGNASTQDITVSVNDVGGVDDDPATGTGTSTGTGSSTGTSTGTGTS